MRTILLLAVVVLLFLGGRIVESYNVAKGFFLNTGGESNHRAPRVSVVSKTTNTAYMGSVGLMNKEVDVAQILSLPEEIYEKQKALIFYFLKRNHKKIGLHGDSFRLIISPTKRMVDLEMALFGKKLTPAERTFAYTLHTNKKEGFLRAQQATNQMQEWSADRSFAYLFASGNYLLLLLKVFLDVVTNSKVVLTGLAGLLQITGANSGETSEHLSSVQILSDLLYAKKSNNHAIPKVSDITDDSHVVKNSLGHKISKATNNNKYDNWNTFKNVNLKDVQDILLSVRQTQNSVSTQHSDTNSNFKQKQGDVVAYNRNFQQALSTETKVWDQFARFS